MEKTLFFTRLFVLVLEFLGLVFVRKCKSDKIYSKNGKIFLKNLLTNSKKGVIIRLLEKNDEMRSFPRERMEHYGSNQKDEGGSPRKAG